MRLALIESTGYSSKIIRPTETSRRTIAYTPFNFLELVNSPTNTKIINKVSKLVYGEQRVRTIRIGVFNLMLNVFQNSETSSLTYAHTEVDWTKRDVAEIAKTQFRTWRTKFQEGNSEEKTVAAALRKRRNKRDIRRTHVS